MGRSGRDGELMQAAQAAAERLGDALGMPASVVADRGTLLFFFGAYGFRMEASACRRARDSDGCGLDIQLLDRLLRMGVLVEVRKNPYLRFCIGQTVCFMESS